ncbi:hypothetical protein LTR17_013883 [Elasticomyces elasticus]|nr:hypothetical protein LTR17_013883 [Elasticomyces elasticus]
MSGHWDLGAICIKSEVGMSRNDLIRATGLNLEDEALGSGIVSKTEASIGNELENSRSLEHDTRPPARLHVVSLPRDQTSATLAMDTDGTQLGIGSSSSLPGQADITAERIGILMQRIWKLEEELAGCQNELKGRDADFVSLTRRHSALQKFVKAASALLGSHIGTSLPSDTGNTNMNGTEAGEMALGTRGLPTDDLGEHSALRLPRSVLVGSDREDVRGSVERSPDKLPQTTRLSTKRKPATRHAIQNTQLKFKRQRISMELDSPSTASRGTASELGTCLFKT